MILERFADRLMLKTNEFKGLPAATPAACAPAPRTQVISAAIGLAVALAVYGIETWNGLRQEEMSGPLRYPSLLKQQGTTLLVAASTQTE
jgi:hypothetical protein